MPDWRKPEDYAYCEWLNLHGWAWEFLRRSETYRQAWREYCRATRDAAAGESPDAARSAELAASLPFSLVNPLDPSLSAPFLGKKLVWAPDVTTGWGVLEGWECRAPEPGEWPGFPREIAFCFDLRYPLNTQIEETTRILRSCERELAEKKLLAGLRENVPKGRARTDKYPLYVRLLDARLAEEIVNRIANHFNKSWIDTHRALGVAKEMAASGYKNLLGKTPAPTSK
jgi:hypothetical protein